MKRNRDFPISFIVLDERWRLSEKSRKLARPLLTNRQVFLHTVRFTFIATLTSLLTSHDKPVQLVAPTTNGTFPDPQRAPRGLTTPPIPSTFQRSTIGSELGSNWQVLRRASHGTTGKNASEKQVQKDEKRFALLARVLRLARSLLCKSLFRWWFKSVTIFADFPPCFIGFLNSLLLLSSVLFYFSILFLFFFFPSTPPSLSFSLFYSHYCLSGNRKARWKTKKTALRYHVLLNLVKSNLLISLSKFITDKQKE